jgi:hypothetical protein
MEWMIQNTGVRTPANMRLLGWVRYRLLDDIDQYLVLAGDCMTQIRSPALVAAEMAATLFHAHKLAVLGDPEALLGTLMGFHLRHDVKLRSRPAIGRRTKRAVQARLIYDLLF